MDDHLEWDYSDEMDLDLDKSEKEIDELLKKMDALIDMSGLDELMDFDGNNEVFKSNGLTDEDFS